MSLLRTIKVRDLIARLEDEDQDALVVFSADYGDRSHTAQAIPIRGDVEEVSLVESGYSDSGFAIADDPDDGDEDDDSTYVVIR